MSTFEIDKFALYVEASDEQVRSYAADPEAYVARWEQRGLASRVPVADGGALTMEERRALATGDYAELYRLGAHPYVLWHFVEAVFVWAGDVSWPEMTERYRTAITPHGRPDFST